MFNQTSKTKVHLTDFLAFTLAEVIITIGIIGVVAALTISLILNSSQKSEYYTGFMNAYQIIDQATRLIMADNNNSLVNLFSSHNNMRDIYCQKLDCTILCDANQKPGVCFHNGTSGWKTLYGSNGWADFTITSRAVLKNGMLTAIALFQSQCNDNNMVKNGENIYCGYVYVDTNGFKNPNILGRDIFGFAVTKEGLIPYGSKYSPSYTDFSIYCNPKSNDTLSGTSCPTKLLLDEQMNY